MPFHYASAPRAAPGPEDNVFALQEAKVWMGVPAGAKTLPLWSEVKALLPPGASPHHVGKLGERELWALEIPKDGPEWRAQDFEWMESRALMGLLPAEAVQALCSARQLLFWEGRSRFCGHCGSRTVDSETERARKCPDCGLVAYPSQAPAVIVSVVQGERLLLAHNKNFRPGLYSLVAGFVDPGESLEQCVVREVAEETGIRVDEVRYLASQPWPFPNSLMVGFTAQHTGGEIKVDGIEIEHAAWFSRDALPDIPSHGTIARRLIDTWLASED
ncbi:MAG: NAD(+) diphosphatase [Spirochaetes bacterium]|nr:NAD(+) diphosphatase [Spirochaetota bacterium]